MARALGIDPAEVRLFAGDAGGAGRRGRVGRADRVRSRSGRTGWSPSWPRWTARLRDAAGQVRQAGRALADRQAERQATLEAAVRAAARGGLPVDRIAAVTGLGREQVQEILDNTPGGGSGPSASGGGPGSGGGGSTAGGRSDPSGGRPRRPVPAASPSRGRSGPRRTGPQPRSRGPPWWKRFFSDRTPVWTVVLLTGGLVASLVAVRYGVAEPGVLAAGVVWWPGQRKAARQLREKVAEANEPLAGAEQAEALLREAVRQHEQGLGERLGWVPALAERLRDLGRTDEEIVDGLADALGVNAQRVRARLADPALAGSVTLPATLDQAVADAGVSADELLDAARAAVTMRSTALGQALVPLDGATQQVVAARIAARPAGPGGGGGRPRTPVSGPGRCAARPACRSPRSGAAGHAADGARRGRARSGSGSPRVSGTPCVRRGTPWRRHRHGAAVGGAWRPWRRGARRGSGWWTGGRPFAAPWARRGSGWSSGGGPRRCCARRSVWWRGCAPRSGARRG